MRHRVVVADRIAVLFTLLALAGAWPSTLEAQGLPRTLTLDEALELAETTSERVAVAEAGVARADAVRALVRSELFPQLFGSASYDRTLRSEFEGLFETDSEPGGGDGGGGDGGGDLDFSNLPFGQANVYRIGLSFSQLLFAGGRVRAQASQAAVRRVSAGLALSSARAQSTLDVAEAFYDAALADRLVAIAEDTYAQADRSLKVTEEQRAAGRLSEFELLRARVARDSLRPSVVRAQNARDLAYLRFKQLIDLPLEIELRLAADLDAPAISPPARFAGRLVEAEQPAPPARLAVAQVQNEVLAADADISIARAERWPAIALRSDFGLVDYPASLPDFDDWRQNWIVGVAMSVPIFTGGRIKANEALARAAADEARATLRLTQELDALDRASTRSEVEAARAEWEASLSTIEQAQRAYEIAELRYREGLSTQLELSDARLQLAQSQATRAEAARTLQVRRIRLALLPELPLAAPSASAVQNVATGNDAQTQVRTPAVPAQGSVAGVTGGR
jgi:outer membrane protein